MKRALFLAAALTLSVATVATAQDQHDDHGGRPAGEARPAGDAHQGGQPGGGHGGAPQGGQPGAQHQAAQPAANAGGFHGQPSGAGQVNQARGPGGQPNGGDRNFQNNGGQRGGFGGDRRGGFDQRGGGFGGERGGGGFNYHGRNFQSFRAAPFNYPGGYGYRRWGIGQRLPRLFLSPGYFINWGAYDLGPPAPGCEWVRYGPDALMVNNYTGQVVDVAYGVFY
jgi:Ni/Co efflux regulator RcnB